MRRAGAGSKLAGVLERSGLHDDGPSGDDLAEAIGGEPGAGEVDAGSGSARARAGGGVARKPKAVESRAAKRVKGRTVYLHDDLFERLLVQSHRKGKTISEYVSMILERQVPDHRSGFRETAEG